MRIDQRQFSDLRPVSFTTRYLDHLPSSVLIYYGKTRVLCTASVDNKVPPHRLDSGGGWLTAEYAMLPASTSSRKSRTGAKGQPDGRSIEIQRLIGRSLRQAINLNHIGPRTIAIDCDVLQADGGTRTAAITGSWVALALCVQDLINRKIIVGKTFNEIMINQIAAVSLGICSNKVLVDLCYEEDVNADTDFNLVGTNNGQLVEFQGSAENRPMKREQIDEILTLGSEAILTLCRLQREAISR